MGGIGASRRIHPHQADAIQVHADEAVPCLPFEKQGRRSNQVIADWIRSLIYLKSTPIPRPNGATPAR